MLEHIAEFTAWPILTGIEHRTTWQSVSHQLRILRCWCRYISVDLEETV